MGVSPQQFKKLFGEESKLPPGGGNGCEIYFPDEREVIKSKLPPGGGNGCEARGVVLEVRNIVKTTARGRQWV